MQINYEKNAQAGYYPAKWPKRAGRRGGYTRIPFGTIDDATDARANRRRGWIKEAGANNTHMNVRAETL